MKNWGAFLFQDGAKSTIDYILIYIFNILY